MPMRSVFACAVASVLILVACQKMLRPHPTGGNRFRSAIAVAGSAPLADVLQTLPRLLEHFTLSHIRDTHTIARWDDKQAPRLLNVKLPVVDTPCDIWIGTPKPDQSSACVGNWITRIPLPSIGLELVHNSLALGQTFGFSPQWNISIDRHFVRAIDDSISNPRLAPVATRLLGTGDLAFYSTPNFDPTGVVKITSPAGEWPTMDPRLSRSKFMIDSSGTVKEYDPEGNTYEYAPLGPLATSGGSSDEKFRWHYYLVKKTDRHGNTITLSRDPSNSLIEQIGDSVSTNPIVFSSADELITTITDPKGGEYVLSYDDRQRLQKIKLPDKSTWEFEYQGKTSLISSIKDPNSAVEKMTYVPGGRIESYKNNAGATTVYSATYASTGVASIFGDMVERTDATFADLWGMASTECPNGPGAISTSNGRIGARYFGKGISTSYQLKKYYKAWEHYCYEGFVNEAYVGIPLMALKRVSKVKKPYGSYDISYKDNTYFPETIHFSDGRQVLNTYDDDYFLTEQTLSKGSYTMTTVLNSVGTFAIPLMRPTSVTENGVTIATYDYYNNGDLKTVTNAAGITVYSGAYYPNGRIQSETVYPYPATTYSYGTGTVTINAAGKPPQVISLNALGDPTQITSGYESVSFGYDENGTLLSTESGIDSFTRKITRGSNGVPQEILFTKKRGAFSFSEKYYPNPGNGETPNAAERIGTPQLSN